MNYANQLMMQMLIHLLTLIILNLYLIKVNGDSAIDIYKKMKIITQTDFSINIFGLFFNKTN